MIEQTISRTRQAVDLVSTGDHVGALAIYEDLARKTGLKAWDYDIQRLKQHLTSNCDVVNNEQSIPNEQSILNRLHKIPTNTPAVTHCNERVSTSSDSPNLLGSILKKQLGVEAIYLVNLADRKDRLIRAAREFAKNDIQFRLVTAISGEFSVKAQSLRDRYRIRSPSDVFESTKHVPLEKRLLWKKELRSGVFSYLLSQQKAFQDAMVNGFRRIGIFDDDVYFSSDASVRLKSITEHLPPDWSIICLAVSDWSEGKSTTDATYRFLPEAGIYHPIPGETCGSFANLYDNRAYKQILSYIDEFDGPFDNAALGAYYHKHRNACFFIQPGLCGADVGESTIKGEARVQEQHCLKMGWPFMEHKEYAKPLHVTILIKAPERSLRIVDGRVKLEAFMSSFVAVSIFYLSCDGIRPLIPGVVNEIADPIKFPANALKMGDLRFLANEMRLPYAELTVFWSENELFTEEKLANVCSRYHIADLVGKIDNHLIGRHIGIRDTQFTHSIIIPTARKLDESWPSIRSALLQNNVNHEVIVVNDNPKDQNYLQRLLEKVSSELPNLLPAIEKRELLKVLFHSNNRKAAAARNTGIYASRGDVISFLDDDDIYAPERLASIEKCLNKTDETIGACYCGYDGVWNGKRDPSRFRDGNFLQDMLLLNYSKHYICTNTVSYKRKHLLSVGGFNESYLRHQDLELMVRFSMKYQIVSVPDYLVKNRPEPSSETFQRSISNLIAIKTQFLYDLGALLKNTDIDFSDKIVAAHIHDTFKNATNVSEDMVTATGLFYRSIFAAGLAN